jgi:two-component system, cell cycle sensor histidine kinase and response regulator CckA
MSPGKLNTASIGKSLRVLLVEDSEDDAELLLHELRGGGYDVVAERVQTPDAMRAALQRESWHIVLSDYSLPGFSGPAALAVLKESNLDLPFIMVSGTIDEETAVASLKAGACDFLLKDKLSRLIPAVGREIREAELRRTRAREHRALEQQLRQAQKMESLGRLAGGIAHDFNNVLTAILGFSDLLLGELDPADRSAADIAEIKKAAESGRRLTRQLLAFSRQQPLEPTRLDLNDAVTASTGMLHQLLGKAVQVETALGSALGSVWADAGQIQQILVNLAVNARDAMPQGGRLRIETYATTVDNQRAAIEHVAAGRYIVLLVTDTGSGMSAETQANIFEPFFTTKAPDRGTGLGLSTVYGIVRQTGGFIDLTSVLGAGTTFRIYLPELGGA